MKFFPATLPTDNKAENVVWNTVKTVLASEEGVAWLGFPIYESHHPNYHAPDILILSRRYGVIVIECKGAWAHNVVAIHGQAWEMEDFYAEEITPVKQVEAQKFAVQNMIENVVGRPCGLVFRTMVALPLILRSEWKFHDHPAATPVTLAEDLTPEGFQAWLAHAHLHRAQPPLDERTWHRMLAACGEPAAAPPLVPPGLAPAAPVGPRLRFVHYAGQPLSNDRLRDLLCLPEPTDTKVTPEPDYWYLVPTAGLERARAQLAPRTQLYERLSRSPEHNQESEARLLFRKALHHFLDASDRWRIARRLDEVVHLRRAIENLTLDNETFRAQIHQDLYAWIDAFHEVEERGLDLETEAATEEQVPAFVHREVAHILGNLQREYHAQLAQRDAVSFEMAARQFLDSTNFHPPATVIMEGFTRLTELQKYFLERCLANSRCAVVIIIPFAESQVEGFEALVRTYQPYRALPHTLEALPARRLKPLKAIAHLKANLFANLPFTEAPNDGTVVIQAFGTRQEEAAACVDAIAALLQEDPPVKARDISVVTRDPAAYKVLLREEAAIRQPDHLLQFDLQPTQLLLTPVGRFVLNLYDVWKEGAFALEATQFSHLLASGWLGQRAQASASRFDALIAAFFASARTLESWQTTFGLLQEARTVVSPDSRIPAAGGDPQDLELWRRALASVHRLVDALFDGQQRTLAAHVRRLREVLASEEADDLRGEERELVREILEVLGAFASTSDLDLHAEEFGAVLNAMVREREQVEDHTRITVTSPESLDGLSKDYVFFLGVDEHRMPSGYAEPWPWSATDIAGHQAQERYLFLAVARAARERLTLYYASVDDRQGCRPSLYLDDTAEILGRSLDLLATAQDAPFELARGTPGPMEPVRRGTVTLEELAQFRLCPRRYQLERLAPGTRRYRDRWHIMLLVQSVWFGRLMANLANSSGPIPCADLEDAWIQVADRCQDEVRRIFPALLKEDWYFLRRTFLKGVRKEAIFYQGRQTDDGLVRVRPRAVRTVNVTLGGRTVRVQGGARHSVQMKYAKAYTKDLFLETWLLPASKPPENGLPGEPPSRYAVQRWEDSTLFNMFTRSASLPSANTPTLDAVLEDLV